MELIPLIEDNNGTLVIKGFAEREWAHTQNLCHPTTLLIPVVADADNNNRKVHIQVRHKNKSFPCCRDIFGGHVTLDGVFWPFLLGEPFDISQIIFAAAQREAGEELRVRNTEEEYPQILTDDRFRQVGDIGEACWQTEGNVERSTIL